MALHKMVKKIHDMLDLQQKLDTQTAEKQVKTQAKLDVMQGQLDNIYKRLDRLGLVAAEDDDAAFNPPQPGSAASGSGDGGSYKPVVVFVRMLTGKCLSILVDPRVDSTKFLVDLVRAKTAADFQIVGMVLASVKVILKTQMGKTLNDETQPLSFYDIQKETELHEMLQLQGGMGKRAKMAEYREPGGRSKVDRLEDARRDLILLRLQVDETVLAATPAVVQACVSLVGSITTDSFSLLETVAALDIPILQKIMEDNMRGGTTEGNVAAIASDIFPDLLRLKKVIEQLQLVGSMVNSALFAHYTRDYFQSPGSFNNAAFKVMVGSVLKLKQVAAAAAAAKAAAAAAATAAAAPP
jgi:hypothetical protein